MAKNDLKTLDDLLHQVKKYISNEKEVELIKKAYYFAREKHEGQFRKSGEEYIYHPVEAAIILTSIYADCNTICAGLLHDVLEDCDVQRDELEAEFGTEITKIVDGVTKISKLHFSTENEALVEYYKKIIVGMSEDVRVIIVKLADRLHNMRTLWATPLDRQKVKAKEVLEILAPIAHHLGIHKIKSELEDLSLRYLKPDVFYDIAEKLNTTKIEREQAVEEMINEVSQILKDQNIKFEIKGRSKSIYSIYKKLEKGRKFSELYDLLALRVLVSTEADCYTSLGLIHSKYKPIPNRFKDYVAMPKPNGYQSLHTTIFGADGQIFEVQIRTKEMDEVAENGVAAHWAYKEKKNMSATTKNSTEAKLQFFKSIIELDSEKMSSEDFVDSVKNEILRDNIYAFTPKGDIFELPNGATPIDFAYKIHTGVGDTMVGAFVNNNIVPLDYVLQNNDIVKIITNRNSKPSKEWLNIAKTTQAKNKIRNFFTKNEKEIYLERGKELLEKELRKKKISQAEFFTDENINTIILDTKSNDFDEVYISIANNKFSPLYVISIIYKDLIKESKQTTQVKPKENENEIIVDGIDNIKVNLSNCCNPIPGDDIIGYISKNNGISVHRRSCPNVEKLDERLISLRWNEITKSKYKASLIINSENNNKAMIDIMQKASVHSISIENIKTLNRDADVIVYEVDIWATSVEKYEKYKRDLENLEGIISVERIMK